MVLLGLVQVLALFFGESLIGKLPKRWFLLTCESLMAFLLWLIYMCNTGDYRTPYPSIVLIMVHVVIYNISLGQLFMYYSIQLLRQTGLVILTNWVGAFMIALFANVLIGKV